MLSAIMVLAAKILDGTRPVHVCEQSPISQADTFQYRGRGNVEYFLHGASGPQLIQFAQQEHGAHHADDEYAACSNARRRFHFRFLRSNTSTAPESAMAAYIRA